MTAEQMEVVLQGLVNLQLVTVAMISVASAIGMGILLILGLSLRRITQSVERVSQTTEHVAEIAAQILREVRNR